MTTIRQGGDDSSPTTSIEWTSYISNWTEWEASVETKEGADTVIPHPACIESAQLRRLSSLAKVSLHVMHACAQSLDDFQIVYASRHGELARTTALLNQLAQSEAASPMGFSLAVLNATTGVYSMARKNRAPSSAVSAGAQTFAMGWLEAAAQSQTANRPVLYAYADAPAPDVYGADAETTGPLHAIAMLLHARPTDSSQTVALRWGTSCSGDLSTTPGLPQSLTFARHLKANKAACWSDARHTFSWKFS